jgi:hypothetical protein
MAGARRPIAATTAGPRSGLPTTISDIARPVVPQTASAEESDRRAHRLARVRDCLGVLQ